MEDPSDGPTPRMAGPLGWLLRPHVTCWVPLQGSLMGRPSDGC